MSSTWNQKRSLVVDNFLSSISASKEDTDRKTLLQNTKNNIDDPASAVAAPPPKGETTSLTGAKTTGNHLYDSRQHALLLMSNQGIAGEQLLDTVRLTIKDLVRDLLGIPHLPAFFRNFEEKFSADSADADDVLEATSGSSGSKQTKNAKDLMNVAIVNSKNNDKNNLNQNEENNNSSGILPSSPSTAAGIIFGDSAKNNNNNNNDASPGKLYAGISAIALVPRLRRHVDAICIACVDRLFNLVGPEISMAASLQDKIGNLHREVQGVRKTLASREELALTQRTELLKELTAAYEQEQAAEARFDALMDKCKLLAHAQGKPGITELFRAVPPPKQKNHPHLRVPVEPVHPQTGTPVIGAKVKQLTDKLEAQWELLSEVDRVKAKAKEESRDASFKIREVKERLAREKEITQLAKKSEEVLKDEVNRLQAKLRQADLMLRAKEHDVELAILREREVVASAGRDSKIQQLLHKQQEQEAKIKRMMLNERLRMEVADFESQMSQLTEQYTQQAATASSQIRKLETELDKTKRELRDAKMNAGEGKLDLHGRSGSKQKDAKDQAVKEAKKTGGGRVGARVPSSQRLQQEQQEALLQQLKDQLRSERTHNERVLTDKEKKIRDKDVEVLSLRDSVSKASAIQMALQGELDALAASAKNNNNNNKSSMRNMFRDDKGQKNDNDDDDGGDDDDEKSFSLKSKKSFSQSGGGNNNNRRRSFNPFADPGQNNNDDDDNEDEYDKIQRLKKEKREELGQFVIEKDRKIREQDELIARLETERASAAADCEEYKRKSAEFEREYEILKTQLEMKDSEMENIDAGNVGKINELEKQLREVRERAAAMHLELESVMTNSARYESEFEDEREKNKQLANSLMTHYLSEKDKNDKDGATTTTVIGATSTQQNNHHINNRTATATSTPATTRILTKRSAQDIAEIERLNKENDFMKSKLSILDEQLNSEARKNLRAAFHASKKRDFGIQVVPLDILANANNNNNNNNRISPSRSSRPIISSNNSNSNNTSRRSGSLLVVDQPPPVSSTNNNVRPSSAASSSGNSNRTERVVKFRDHHHPHLHNNNHGDNNTNKIDDDSSVSHRQKRNNDHEETGAASRKVPSPQRQHQNNSSHEDTDRNNDANMKPTTRKHSPSSTITTNKNNNDHQHSSESNYVSPYKYHPAPEDPKMMSDTTTNSGNNNPKAFRPGSSNMRTRSSQLRLEMNQRLGVIVPSSARIDHNDNNHEINDDEFRNLSMQQSHKNKHDDRNLNHHHISHHDDDHDGNLDDDDDEKKKPKPILSNFATALMTPTSSDQQNRNNVMMPKSGNANTAPTSSTSTPAWIDMTELVLKAQKYLNPPPHSSTSNNSSHPNNNNNNNGNFNGNNTFYRNKHQPGAGSIIHHENRCHDLRLGSDEASTQTEDVIIVEHSNEVSLLEMMKPLAISNFERQTKLNQKRNGGFGLDKKGYAVATPYNNKDVNEQDNKNNSQQREEQFVALVVKLSDLTGFTAVAYTHHYQNQNDRNASSVIHHHLQQYTSPSGETVLHYPSGQGAVVAKIQVPPLKFSFQLHGDDEEEDDDNDENNNRKSKNKQLQHPSSAKSRPSTASTVKRPLSAFSATSTEVAGGHNNNDDMNNIEDDDDDDIDCGDTKENELFKGRMKNNNHHRQEKSTDLSKHVIVPHSFGTAQLTGTAVADQLQNLLKKAITQWKRDNLKRVMNDISAKKNQQESSSSKGDNNHSTTNKNNISTKIAPRRPLSALSNSKFSTSAGVVVAASSNFTSRPRDGLYIARNPVAEGIEIGSARQPHYRHPVPPEQPLRVAQNIPLRMERNGDDPDRKYVLSDEQRVPATANWHQ